jgi:hypothetical protein
MTRNVKGLARTFGSRAVCFSVQFTPLAVFPSEILRSALLKSDFFDPQKKKGPSGSNDSLPATQFSANRLILRCAENEPSSGTRKPGSGAIRRRDPLLRLEENRRNHTPSSAASRHFECCRRKRRKLLFRERKGSLPYYCAKGAGCEAASVDSIGNSIVDLNFFFN